MDLTRYFYLAFLFGISTNIWLGVGRHVYDRQRQQRSASATGPALNASSTVSQLLANARPVPCLDFRGNYTWNVDSMHALSSQAGQAARSTVLPGGGAMGQVPTVTPSVRMVSLNTSQMHDVFQNKGGNYLHDFMATTQQEAESNFPNLLLMTTPIKIAGSNQTITVYDNYLAQQTIMKDLSKLQFYISSTQPPVSTRSDQTSNQRRNITAATPSLKNNTKPSHNISQPSSHNISTRPVIYPGYSHHQDSTSTAKPSDKSTSKLNEIIGAWTTKHSTGHPKTFTSKTLTEGTEFMKTTRKSSPDSHMYKTTTNPNTVKATSGKQTTVDPEVAKSLLAFDRYVHGYLGSNGSGVNLNTVWRQANTTIHPESLLELEPGSRRRRRQADGSISMEQYCQMKGSKTDDGYLHMCSTCAVITKLPDDYFPRYINEAVCKTGDSDCFVMAGIAHGQCRQRTITLNIMRKRANQCLLMTHNGESIMTDDWELYPQTVRVSCECLINKRSMFAPYIGASRPHG